MIIPIASAREKNELKNLIAKENKIGTQNKKVEYQLDKLHKSKPKKSTSLVSSFPLKEKSNFSFAFTKILIVLVVISLIIFFGITLYSIKKVLIYKQMELRKIEDEYGLIKIVDKLRLGFTKKLYVIEVEQKRILLAAYKNKLKLISNLGQVYYEDEAISTETENTNLFQHLDKDDEDDDFRTNLK